jgi:competence protein ComEA
VNQKLKYLWWGILGVLLLAAALKFLLPVKTPVKVEESVVGKEIVVYIGGAVNNPGLIHLPLDARLDDALAKAGLRNDADMEALNPAQKLKDGQKIVVPSAKPEEETSSSGPDGASVKPAATPGKSAPGTPSRVNINTAGVSELDAIPGIGPVLAQRIVDYRAQNGLFAAPEDLQNVSGIGAKTYEKMAPYVTVGR